MKRTFCLILCLFVMLASPVLADWQVIWEGSFTFDEPPGSYEGYFLAEKLYDKWPSGFLRREVWVEYLEGDDSAGGVISFHVIRFPPECGWSLWSIGSYITSPGRYYQDTGYFETSPNGVGLVYEGQSAGRCHARVSMRLSALACGRVKVPWTPWDR